MFLKIKKYFKRHKKTPTNYDDHELFQLLARRRRKNQGGNISVGYRSEVLQKINAGRVAAGLLPLDEIPRGRKGDARDCPLAKAFSGLGNYGGNPSVSSRTVQGLDSARAHKFAAAIDGRVTYYNGEATVIIPSTLGSFVEAFDAGAYPELITY